MRVLVVDDEVRLARAVTRGLEDSGFAVTVANDGVTGLHLATEENFDAIILDIMLPGMNGYEICKQLRAAENWTPILMLTAKDGEYDEADALDLGADDYLRKPFSYVVLVSRLHALLRRGAPERPAVLQVGPIELDPGKRSVRRNGTQMELTPREFQVLEYLLRRAGEPSTKYEILEHVWGADWDRDPNVVEVYIGYLRRKVDDPFDHPVIETVRGHGYRIVSAADGD